MALPIGWRRVQNRTPERQIMEFRILPGGMLNGETRVPGDKSISHRSIMLGALADGTTEVTGFLEGQDALATVAAFRAMGVVIEGPAKGRVVIQGVGLHGLKAPAAPLDLGNSGTSIRAPHTSYPTTTRHHIQISMGPMRS